MKRSLIVFALLLLFCNAGAKEKIFTVESPDKNISVKIAVGEVVKYSVFHLDNLMLDKSPISMGLENAKAFGVSPELIKSDFKSVNGKIQTSIYKKKEITEKYNELTLIFKGNYRIVFRAYDDGIAYRFVSTAKETETLIVNGEQAVFNFPGKSKAYVTYVRPNGYHPDNMTNNGTFDEQFFKSFVNTYEYISLPAWDKKRLAFMPLLVEVPTGEKIVLTEADLLNYPGMYLNNSDNSNTIAGVFAPCPKDKRPGGKSLYHEVVTSREQYIASVKGNTNFPWRTLIIAKNDAELLNNDMVYKLATPSRIEDISWIKPGKAAWEWWNSTNLYQVDFETGINFNTYKYYIDFAANNKLEYLLIDHGWYAGIDIMNPVSAIKLPELIKYAKSKGIDVILWTGYYPFMKDMEKVCRHYSEMGIKGFKIDFMDRDDQQMVDFHYKAGEVAAKYKLVVDFHGTYKPTGLQRTLPNVLNFEAVQGLEHMKWASPQVDQITYDVTMTFIRMPAGPLDYTQGAMNNVNRKNYRPVHSEPMSAGTRCRQIAEYIIFESPLSMLCDSPSNYEKETECTDFIAAIPVVWDNTLSLAGEITKYACIARQKGNEWYVGAINNWEARTLSVDLSFLGSGNFKAEVFRDGINAEKVGRDYKKEIMDIPANRRLTFDMAPGGGYAIRIFNTMHP